MIIFIGDGLIIILVVVFLLCGYTAGQHIANFLIDYGTIIIIILSIIIAFISLITIFSSEKEEKTGQILCSISFTITDISKIIIFYVFVMAWAYDYAYFSSTINSIASLFILPFCLTFISAVSITPSLLIRCKILDGISSQIISSIFAVLIDVIFTLIFVFLLRCLIVECLTESYNRMLSNGWWESFLHIKN